jgi:DNA processing protein
MSDETAELPAEAWATALSGLEGMGPRRLSALLAHHRDPHRAWMAVASGDLHRVPELAAALGSRGGQVVAEWREEARRVDPGQLWAAHTEAGVGVVLDGHAGFPSVFSADPYPPAILFHRGDPDGAVATRVAIVGTRDCTRYGHDLAFELGRDLSAVGVSIVSGLALGIDGAAHAGALDARAAPPVAVVGSGLDVIYPRRHGGLWREVARRGVIWSEYPLGTQAKAWHFPARNRLIAALADVVVVVESHRSGGALLTVEEATLRGRPVMAVPGPVRSPASEGCNQLLAESPSGVVRDATDVLVALNFEPGSRRSSIERRPQPSAADAELLEALGWQPATLDQLVSRIGSSLAEVSGGLLRLELDGWVAPRGGWYERRAKADG